MFGKRSTRVSMGDKMAKFADQMPVIGSIRRKRTRQSNILRGLGAILFWVSLILLLPMCSAFMYHEDPMPFIITFAFTFLVSMFLILTYGSSKIYHHTDGTMMIIGLWLSLFVIGMIPYLLSGKCNDIIDALFESVSGFTTVGATIFDNVDALPKSLLLWRVLTQWVGGIIIVLLFMVILPMFVSGRRSIVKDDLQPLTTEYGVQMKVIDVAKQFVLVYVGLTLIFSIALCLTGLPLDHAMHIGLSTISIGGFTYSSSNLTTFTDIQKIMVAVFLIISATNFYLHFRAIVKTELKVYFEDTEFKAMIVWYAILTLLIFLILKDKFVDGFFMIISMSTTAGFVSDPDFSFDKWTPAAMTLIMIGMFVGGSSGSTAGGVKLSRLIIILKSLAIDAYSMVNPNVIQVPKINGEAIEERKIHNAYAVFTLFVAVIALSTIFYCVVGGVEVRDSLFASFSIATATGTGTGPWAASFASMNGIVKIYTCVLMLFARMEMISLIAIFMPRFWGEAIRNKNYRRETDGTAPIIRNFNFKKN